MNKSFKKSLVAASLATASVGANAEIIFNQIIKGANNSQYAIELKNVGDEVYETKTKLKMYRYTMVDGAQTNEKIIPVKNLEIQPGGVLVVYPNPSSGFIAPFTEGLPLFKSGTAQVTDANVFELVEIKAPDNIRVVFDAMTIPFGEGINIQRNDDVAIGQSVEFDKCEWTASYTTQRNEDGTEFRDADNENARVALSNEIVGVGLGQANLVESTDNAYPEWNAECFAAAAPSVEVSEGTAGTVSYDEAQDGVTVTLTMGANVNAGDAIALSLTNDVNETVATVDGSVPTDWNGTDTVAVTIPLANVSVSDDDNLVAYSVTATVADSDASQAVAFSVNLTPPNVVSATITGDETVSEVDTVTLSGSSSTGEELTYAWSVEEANGLELTLSGADTDTLMVTAPVVAVDTNVTLKLTVTSGEQTEEAVHTVTIVNQAGITAQDINISTVAGTGTVTGAGDYFSAADTAVLTLTSGSTVAGLTVNADGSYSFDPADSAYVSMVKGDSQTLQTTVTATDQFGGEAVSTITIDIRGVVEVGEQENSNAGSLGGLLALLAAPFAWLRRRRA